MIQGVFVHKDTGEIYLHVSVNSKEVLEVGSVVTEHPVPAHDHDEIR